MSHSGTIFSWLHLSDIHFGHGKKDKVHVIDQQATLEHLERDISILVRDGHVPAPEALFLTGDVAFSAGARNLSGDEYGVAHAFLSRLTSSLGIDRANCFCVPGNHDVLRAENGTPEHALIEEIRSGKRQLASLDPEQSKLLNQRLSRYLSFAREAPIAYECHAPNWVARNRRAKSGLMFDVVGVNTALLSNDEYDFGNLQVTPGSLDSFPGSTDSVKFLLTHHPFSVRVHRIRRHLRPAQGSAWGEEKGQQARSDVLGYTG